MQKKGKSNPVGPRLGEALQAAKVTKLLAGELSRYLRSCRGPELDFPGWVVGGVKASGAKHNPRLQASGNDGAARLAKGLPDKLCRRSPLRVGAPHNRRVGNDSKAPVTTRKRNPLVKGEGGITLKGIDVPLCGPFSGGEHLPTRGLKEAADQDRLKAWHRGRFGSGAPG